MHCKKQVMSSTSENDSLNINEMSIQFDKLYEFNIKEEEIDDWLLITCFSLIRSDFKIVSWNLFGVTLKNIFCHSRKHALILQTIIYQVKSSRLKWGYLFELKKHIGELVKTVLHSAEMSDLNPQIKR